MADYARAEATLQPLPYPKNYPKLKKLEHLRRESKLLGKSKSFYQTPLTIFFHDGQNSTGFLLNGPHLHMARAGDAGRFFEPRGVKFTNHFPAQVVHFRMQDNRDILRDPVLDVPVFSGSRERHATRCVPRENRDRPPAPGNRRARSSGRLPPRARARA